MVQTQFNSLAERINGTMAGMQTQNIEDRRRLAYLERRMESRQDERAKHEGEHNAREKTAEIQGSVTGLIEEMQQLTRRVESLDERLWARTSGVELSKHRRELEQQVQSLEHQSRLAAAASEEAQRRQAAKLKRSENAAEEQARRLTKVEEQVRTFGQQRDSQIEGRLGDVEQQIEHLMDDFGAMRAQVEEDLANVSASAAHEGSPVNESMDEALRASERELATLDHRLTGQVEDMASALASLRVKVDGQLQRVGTLADRLETAHMPALDFLRDELGQLRNQDRRELENEIAMIRERTQDTTEGYDELREAVRQARTELTALSTRASDEHPAIRDLEERCGELADRCDAQERDFMDMREHLESFHHPDEQAGDDGMSGEKFGLGPEVEEALEATEQSVAQLDKRLTGQFDDMTAANASVRVKLDGQLQRVSALAERLETAHEPALEALRVEAAQARAGDRRELEAEMAALRSRLQDVAESSEEMSGECREGLRKARADFEAAQLQAPPPSLGDDGRQPQQLRVLEQRFEAHAQDLRDLQDRFEASPMPESGLDSAAGGERLGVSEDSLDEVAQAMERALAALEKRLIGQVEDVTASLASMRVKADGQMQRMNTISERAETAHEPALETLRGELTSLRLQDRREMDAEIVALRDRLEDPDRSARASPRQQARNDSDESLRALQLTVEGLTAHLESAATMSKELRAEVDLQKQRTNDLAANLESASLDEAHVPTLQLVRQEMVELSKASSSDKQQDRHHPDVMGALSKSESGIEALSERCRTQERELGKLQERIDVQDGAFQEAEGVLAKLHERVDALPDAADAIEKDSGKEAMEALESFQLEMTQQRQQDRRELEAGIATLRSQVRNRDPADDTTGIIATSLRQLEERFDSHLQAFREAEGKLKELYKRVGTLPDTKDFESQESCQKEFRDQLRNVSGSLKDLATHEQLQELEERLVERDKASEAPAHKPVPELVERLAELERRLVVDFAPVVELGKRVNDLEEHITASSGGGVPSPPGCYAPAADERARFKVQDKVEELTQQITEELGSLGRHQEQITGAHATLDALATRVMGFPTVGEGADSTELGVLCEKLEKAWQRLQAVEETGGSLKKELDQLQGPRKVGISMVGGTFSLADARTQLELLAQQVAELQKGGGAGTAAQERKHSEAPDMEDDKDVDLNFSLTETMDRVGGKLGGSMEYSLTQSLSESVPILSAPPQRRGAAGTSASTGVGSAVGSAAALRTPGGGSPGSLAGSSLGSALGSSCLDGADEDDVDAATSPSEAGKADSASGAQGAKVGDTEEASDAAAKARDTKVQEQSRSGVGIGRSRAQPPPLGEEVAQLTRVDEESSGAEDHSAGSQDKGDTAKLLPKMSQQLPKSPASQCGTPLSTFSVNDVSIGQDYSVEDSLELEKCDFVEEVRPYGPLTKQIAESAAAGEGPGLGAATPVRAAGASGASGTSQAAAADATKPVGSDARDSLATKPAVGLSSVAAPSSSLKADEDSSSSYEEESFEESIEEEENSISVSASMDD